jgi:hypothetical protein
MDTISDRISGSMGCGLVGASAGANAGKANMHEEQTSIHSRIPWCKKMESPGTRLPANAWARRSS